MTKFSIRCFLLAASIFYLSSSVPSFAMFDEAKEMMEDYIAKHPTMRRAHHPIDPIGIVRAIDRDNGNRRSTPLGPVHKLDFRELMETKFINHQKYLEWDELIAKL